MIAMRCGRLLSLLRADCVQTGRATRSYGRPAMVPLTEVLDESLQSQGKPNEGEIRKTKLDNGVQVISLAADGGVSRISIFIKAGSRYEDASNLGITHVLRNAAFLTNKAKSSLGIVREMQQHGVSLGATNSRDHFIYSGACTKDAMEPLLENIASSIYGPIFQRWEVNDAHHLCLLDRESLEVHGQLNVLDKLHYAAFRKGLGNSIFCAEHRGYSGDEMTKYMKSNFVGERVSVVAVGCDHDSLVKSVTAALGGLPQGSSPATERQKYHGGEARHEADLSLTHTAFAAHGASHQSKDILKFGLLHYLIGSAPFIKWSSNTVSSRLNRAIAASTDSPFMASALNVSHSDAGLFGFYAITEPSDTGKVIKAAVNEFKAVASGDFKDDELVRAKNQLKARILMSSENKDARLEDIAHQMFAHDSYRSPLEICKEVDSISANDIIKVGKALFAGKGTLVVSGDLSSAPYYDELI